MKLELDQGIVIGYLCSKCNGYNDILRGYCIHCNSYRDNDRNYFPFEVSTILSRGILIEYPIRSKMTNDDRVELHAKFYAQAGEEIRINNMTYDQLVAWEEELEQLVIEAKAKMQRSSQERRERQQKMTKEERDRLISNPDMTVTEGLTAPKLRKDRQTKADKMAADFAAMNIPAEMINALMAGISPGKTAVSEVSEEKKEEHRKERGFTFNKNSNGTSGTTQDTLLAEVLSSADLSSSNVDYLERKYSIASEIVVKTASRQVPEKMLELYNRIEELKRQNEELSSSFDPSKLFG